MAFSGDLNTGVLRGLTREQARGVAAGLTREQVNHAWFSYSHAEAAEKGISYEAYAGLSYGQVCYGILKGLTRQQLAGLNDYQINGISAGLSREQVSHGWFSSPHAEAAEKGIPYEVYAGLSYEQVCYGILKGLTRQQVAGLDGHQINGIRAGLSREQVSHDWFSLPHAEAAEKGIPYEVYAGLHYEEVWWGILKGLTRQQVEGLEGHQIDGIHAGLSREQVSHDWFSLPHAEAAEKGIPYEVYAGLHYEEVWGGILKGLTRQQVEGLNDYQINGVRAGLSREQVSHDWFSSTHAEAAEKGISYEVYAELNRDQVCYGILKGLTRQQVEGLNQCQINGVRAGLSREQVSHDWFSSTHVRAAERGIPYKVYSGAQSYKVYELVADYLAAKEKALKYGGLAEAQLKLLDTAQILAVIDHGMPFDRVNGLEGQALKDALREHVAQQKLALCLAHHQKMAGKAPQALQMDDIYYHIGAFVGGLKQPKPGPSAASNSMP
jgi:hypothetical protein